jgi:hypothetical protein
MSLYCNAVLVKIRGRSPSRLKLPGMSLIDQQKSPPLTAAIVINLYLLRSNLSGRGLPLAEACPAHQFVLGRVVAVVGLDAGPGPLDLIPCRRVNVTPLVAPVCQQRFQAGDFGIDALGVGDVHRQGFGVQAAKSKRFVDLVPGGQDPLGLVQDIRWIYFFYPCLLHPFDIVPGG